MRTFRLAERERAIHRGMEFIYRTACEPENFDQYSYDFLCCFHVISASSSDPDLKRQARAMGRERARAFRRKYPRLPADVDADMIAFLVFGDDAAIRLGVRENNLKDQIRRVAGGFAAKDYLWFDAPNEPPPVDIPEECECGALNTRGKKVCRRCKQPLEMMSRYAIYIDALTRAYIGERYGVTLGARYADVIKWLPGLRPYEEHRNGDNPHFYWEVYAITHVVYTMNDYSLYRLSPRWFPDEFAFLKKNLKEAIAMEDAETLGEFMDALKAFGLGEAHPLIRQGVDYLLATQNEDGSWGDMEAEDIYGRYHPTWTAIDGLRQYAWRGERLSFPRLRPLIEQWSAKPRRYKDIAAKPRVLRQAGSAR